MSIDERVEENERDISIERLTLEDYVSFFEKTRSDFVSFRDEDYLKERAIKLANNAENVVCRVNKSRIIAIIAFYMNKPPLCYITHVSVCDSYKRQGLATMMLKKLESEVKKRGYSLMKLEVRKKNYNAIRVYENIGFKISLDSSEGSCYMEKRLQ